QDDGGDIEDVLAQDFYGLQGRLAADAGAARGPGSAAIGRVIGISQDNTNPVHRYAEHAADDLRGQRFRTLPLLGDTGVADYRSLRVQPHRDAILRRYLGAADPIESRAGIGDFDKARNADAAKNVLLAQCRLLGAQRVVVHHLDEFGERRMVRQLLEPQAGG